MADRDDFLRGFKVAWDATPALAALRVYRQQKPPDLSVAFPYVVVRDQASRDGGWSTHRERWLHTIDFEVYAKTPEAAADVRKVIAAAVGATAFMAAVTAAIDDGRSGRVVAVRAIGQSSLPQDKDVYRETETIQFQTDRLRLA